MSRGCKLIKLILEKTSEANQHSISNALIFDQLNANSLSPRLHDFNPGYL